MSIEIENQISLQALEDVKNSSTDYVARAIAIDAIEAIKAQRVLTDDEITKIAESMDGGLEGFLKGWGWVQFARAVLVAQEAKA